VTAGPEADGQISKRILAALMSLGSGLLTEPHNHELCASLSTPEGVDRFWYGLLRWVHQCVCLLKADACGLLQSAHACAESQSRFRSLGPRGWLERCAALRGDQNDPSYAGWTELQRLLQRLAEGDAELDVPATGGLFGRDPACPVTRSLLSDRSLLLVLDELGALATDAATAVDWRSLGLQQLGLTYERLLENVPHVNLEHRRFELRTPDDKAHSRRRRGSYYTPARLIDSVLEGALEPLLVEAELSEHPAVRAERLLDLRLIDPACGSGHFLVAAARKLATRLARARRQADDEPGARQAHHDVIQRCIYGIDLDPLAAELCVSTLWFEAGSVGFSFDDLRAHVRVGNALLGAADEPLADGAPDAAWRPTEADQRAIARGLHARNRAERQTPAAELELDSKRAAQQRAADAWCSAFLWPKTSSKEAENAPTFARFVAYVQGKDKSATARGIQRLCAEHRVLHWPLAFAEIVERGGFDLVLGNPPWIAHAGRAAQPLEPRLKAFFQHRYEAFADYPTTHGMFISNAARALREGGALGLVIPSSVSELAGYEPTRRAHDRLCEVESELKDFGEGQFEGVTQPCMALVSRRRHGGRSKDSLGAPWPMLRPDLDDASRALLARLTQLPQLPAQLFGERGVQSDRALRPHFVAATEPKERFTTAIREGSDVREFQLLAPRMFVDREALGARIRSSDEFESVRVVVRQTARFPIAALSDGKAFRNSLLAAFETPEWPAPALVALLNSSLIRWLHYARFRDARQPILPQLKIAHLRAIPTPPKLEAQDRLALIELGERLSSALSATAAPDASTARAELDALVHRLYGLGPAEAHGIDTWHATLQAPPRPRRALNAPL
jgi:hypothetical protein